MKKVSVVIPVYNAKKYLRQCLESVLSQTLSDIEIICVDDGSTDNSLDILKEYSSKDSRIKILQQKNQYAGVARNNGMSVATGEYIHFMDSDDWVEENTYERLYDIAKKNNVDFVKFKYNFYDEKTQQKYSNACSDIANIDKKYFEKILNVKENFEILAKAPDSPWSGFYKLEFLKSNNCVFDDFICANDVGFFFRCLVNARNVYLCNEKFVNYRINIATSLVSRRAYHFDCQIALYEVIDRYMQSYSSEMGNIVRKILLDALFVNYKKFIKDKNLEKSIKKDIKNKTANFIKTIDKTLISNRFKIKDYKMLNKIFSITNEYSRGYKYKVVTFLGIKFKFKIKRKELLLNKIEIKKDKLLDKPQLFPIRLTDIERNLLVNVMNETTNYLEFGSGGSTFLALFNNHIKNIVSVESDENWLNHLREWNIIKTNEKNKKLIFKRINIGETGEWGIPINKSSQDLFPNYSAQIFEENLFDNNYNTVFIDGRFRIACTLQTILNCSKSTKILMHDFSIRPEYHVILKYLDIVDIMDTMCLFKIKDNINFDEVNNDYENYKYDFN